MAASFGPNAACSRKRTASAAVVGCAAGIVLAGAAGGAGGAAPGGGLVAVVVDGGVLVAVIGGTAPPSPPPLPRQPASGTASASAATVAGSPAPGLGERGRFRAVIITCSSRSARGADTLGRSARGSRDGWKSAHAATLRKVRNMPESLRRCPRARRFPRRAGDRVLRSRLIVCCWTFPDAPACGPPSAGLPVRPVGSGLVSALGSRCARPRRLVGGAPRRVYAVVIMTASFSPKPCPPSSRQRWAAASRLRQAWRHGSRVRARRRPWA